ncbi:MAG: type II secretion system protein [Lachnospiraceae bacterium]|nr:type II secretion system protein [Lachnospiraceae bacterium]
MKKEMNNKGFSLVELIIVIAIMVILIAVLAPQYLRYVEKSRVSSDQNTVVEYINAMQTVASDPDINLDSTKTYTVTLNGTTGMIDVSGDLQTVLMTYGILDSTTMSSSKIQSTAYKNSNGVYTLTYAAVGSGSHATNMWQVKVTAGNVDMSGAVTTP